MLSVVSSASRTSLFGGARVSAVSLARAHFTTGNVVASSDAAPGDEVKPDMKLLSRLRKETELSIKHVRTALIKTNNDYDLALEELRKLGASVAAKVSGRSMGEGLVFSFVKASDASSSLMMEMSCETDFVAYSQLMQKTSTSVGERLRAIYEASPSVTAGALRSATPSEELTTDPEVSASMHELVGKLSENIALQRAVLLKAPRGGLVGSYTHLRTAEDIGGRLSASVVFAPAAPVEEDFTPSEELKDFANKVAQHVVGSTGPGAVGVTVADLLEQPFLFDPSTTVANLIKKHAQSTPGGLELAGFERFDVGVGPAFALASGESSTEASN
ncbi:hypothetical protein H696_03158 [Fonticula alba]|uniref:Elongation factor Ts, mitochondrial n=1 Tax=Fonticula alba TaxID=691883 RepID=A0A058ZBK4_FONAL|nr:hypothetical protein H696_03158 [Fonticula alba]KCV70807.1 hypothetical protein H696_03158 [Fonticula alba]|eukprot:XP_009495323.1 hypothetical protein H696_03158 [Fonticula alba]